MEKTAENQSNEAVTDTDTSNASAVTGTHTDKDQAKLLGGLASLDEKLEELSKAGIMDKGKKAEAVITQARECVAQNIFAIHKLMNQVNRVDAKLEAFKLKGFGG